MRSLILTTSFLLPVAFVAAADHTTDTTDQVKKAELEKTIAATTAALAKHPAAFPEVLVTSSRSGAGMPELRAAMVRLLHERA